MQMRTRWDADVNASELNEMKRLDKTSQDEVFLTDNFLKVI
jgi:hypothetical protein